MRPLPYFLSVLSLAGFADTLAVNGDFIYTANSTNMCVYDYSQNMWMRGTFLVCASLKPASVYLALTFFSIAALYISSSPFDPWIYVTEVR